MQLCLLLVIGLSLAVSVSCAGERPGLPLTITPFPAAAAELPGHGAFPLEGKVQQVLKRPVPAGWKPTGFDRTLYLDLAEPIVRMAAAWVDENGAVIDPVLKKEWGQTSSRFASSAAVLIHFGRCNEYLDAVCRVMELCCRRLASGEAKSMSPDFWMREIIIADACLDGIAPAERQAAWRADLRRIVPEAAYQCVDPTHGKKLEELHNWAVYSSGGEGLRDLAGLANPDAGVLSGKGFYDLYMKPQMAHMTAYGMYRDPGDPITYDVTTRLQYALPLAFGMESPLAPALTEMLRRSGLTGLLFISPDGYIPYGGRSSQFQFQEGMFSALCELEARRYAPSDPKLAGAFKRQARLCALTSRRWVLGMTPVRHLKNGYHPQTSHGIDGYGQYSVYSLLASSFYGLAALLADDAIPEQPAPAELGGYAFALSGAFHKVFASAGGTYVEIDTAADGKYDGTGLGRVLFSGTPVEMVLGMPFTNHPEYRLADGESAKQIAAIGPVWEHDGREERLAGLSKGLSSTVVVEEESPAAVRFRIRYAVSGSALTIEEVYAVQAGSLEYAARVRYGDAPAQELEYLLPVLETDGASTSETVLAKNAVRGKYLGAEWQVEWTNGQARWEEEALANRNGRYRLLRLRPADADSFRLVIRNHPVAE